MDMGGQFSFWVSDSCRRVGCPGAVGSQPVGWVLLFLAGGIGGALCDQIHVRAGVLAYPHPFVFDQAWWVAPQFGVALLVILAGARPFAPRSRARSRVVLHAALFLGAYGATGLCNRWP